MPKTNTYWIGEKPSDGKRWAYAEHATVEQDAAIKESVFRMYRRYVKQWNDIELDLNRSLQEHSHEICGAQVVGAGRMFVLHDSSQQNEDWILEVKFARGFTPFHPGWSCGKNPFRSVADIASIRLHWRGTGNQRFRKWLEQERTENTAKGECDDYKK